MSIICRNCQVELRPKKNGFAVEAMRVDGAESLHEGDLWACKSCGIEVVAGLGKPIVSHYQPTYERMVDSFSPVLRFWRDQKEKDAYRAAQNEKALEFGI